MQHTVEHNQLHGNYRPTQDRQSHTPVSISARASIGTRKQGNYVIAAFRLPDRLLAAIGYRPHDPTCNRLAMQGTVYDGLRLVCGPEGSLHLGSQGTQFGAGVTGAAGFAKTVNRLQAVDVTAEGNTVYFNAIPTELKATKPWEVKKAGGGRRKPKAPALMVEDVPTPAKAKTPEACITSVAFNVNLLNEALKEAREAGVVVEPTVDGDQVSVQMSIRV